MPELEASPAKCGPLFLSSLGSHPNPSTSHKGAEAGAAVGFTLPVPGHLKTQNQSREHAGFVFRPEELSRGCWAGRGRASRVGNVAALGWENRFGAVRPRARSPPCTRACAWARPLRHSVPQFSHLWPCTIKGLGAAVHALIGAAWQTGKGGRGVRRVEVKTSPVLGQLEVARAQELAQHRVEVRSSG